MKQISIILTGILCLLVTSCTKKDSTPTPSPDFTIILDNDVAPAKVKFENISTQALSYTWEFSTGDRFYNSDAEYVFHTPGIYHVTLIARNGDKLAQITKQVIIKQPYQHCQINSVKIVNVPITDNGSAWDLDGSTPDIYFRILNSSGGVLYSAPEYYINPQTLPLDFTMTEPLDVSPISSVIQLEVLDYDSGFSPDIMGGISFAPSIAQLNEDDPYPSKWLVSYDGVSFELGLQWE